MEGKNEVIFYYIKVNITQKHKRQTWSETPLEFGKHTVL